MVAQQRIAELHRTAAHHRLVHTTRDARQPDTDSAVVFARRLRRRFSNTQPASR
jgi:hypothetical protein